MAISGPRKGIALPAPIVTNDFGSKMFLVDSKDLKGGWTTVPTHADLTADTWDGVFIKKRTQGMIAVVLADETDGGQMNIYQMVNNDPLSPDWQKKEFGATTINLNNPQTVADLAARDALSPVANDYVNVVDARFISSVTNITNATTGVVTVDNIGDIVEGSNIVFNGVTGMALPDAVYSAINVSGTTFDLYDEAGTTPIDTSALGTYTGGGTVQLSVPFSGSYVYDGASWLLVYGVGGVSPAAVDANTAARHTRNQDTQVVTTGLIAVTGDDLKTHLDDLSIHRPVTNSGDWETPPTANTLWDALKTQQEIAASNADAEAAATGLIDNATNLGGNNPSTTVGASQAAIQGYVALELLTVGGAQVEINQVKYSQLKTRLDASQLQAGAFYQVTDYQCIRYDEVNAAAVTNPATENLILFAISNSKLDGRAISLEYPEDIIYYDATIDETLTSLDPMRGLITYRHDTKNNVSTHYDWRNALYGVHQLVYDAPQLSPTGSNYDGSAITRAITKGSYHEVHCQINLGASSPASPTFTSSLQTAKEIVAEDGTSFGASGLTDYLTAVNGYVRMIYNPQDDKFYASPCPQINDINGGTYLVNFTDALLSSAFSVPQLSTTGAITNVSTFGTGTPKGVKIGKPFGTQRYNMITFENAPSFLTIGDESLRMRFLGGSPTSLELGTECYNNIIKGEPRWTRWGNEFQNNFFWALTNGSRLGLGAMGGDSYCNSNTVFLEGELFNWNFESFWNNFVCVRASGVSARNNTFETLEDSVLNWTLSTAHEYNSFAALENVIFLPSANFNRVTLLRPRAVSAGQIYFSNPQSDVVIDDDRFQVTVSLSSSQILNLHTTPVQILAGVVDKTFLIEAMKLDYTFNTADYNGGQTIQIVYPTDSLLTFSFNPPNLGVSLFAYYQYPTNSPIQITSPAADIEGQGLEIIASADLANGGAAGTMDLTFYIRTLQRLPNQLV